MDSNKDQLLLDIEQNLEEEIVKINKELIKTKDACTSALDKINGLIAHLDESTSSRLDSIHVSECAAKRRLYVKLALLGQKMSTVAASKKILEELMVLGVPHYVDCLEEDKPSVALNDSEPNVAASCDNSETRSSEDQAAASPPPVPDRDMRDQFFDQDVRFRKAHGGSRAQIAVEPGDIVSYSEHYGSVPVRASVISTFNDSCVIQITSTRIIKQVPYSSLDYYERR